VTVLPHGAPVPTLPPTSTVAPMAAHPAGSSGSPLLLVGLGLAAHGIVRTSLGRGRTIRR
jgi:hypothetical protein